jgi:hypothetical protein
MLQKIFFIISFREVFVFQSQRFIKLCFAAEQRFIASREIFHCLKLVFRDGILADVVKFQLVLRQGFYDFPAGFARREIIDFVHGISLCKVNHLRADLLIFIKNFTMHQTFNITMTSRQTLAKFLDNHSLEQLNKVPTGFNNNLIWNIAHIIVVQQMLVYNLSGLPMMVSQEMIDSYKRGTKPERDLTQPEVDEIRSLLFSTIEQTKKDFENGIFENFQEFTSMSGYTMRSAEDAMAFNYYHEATHTGIMMGIRKFV